jgi:hypothetical protein
MNKKIFIQIASYRDPELIPTIKDCIENSTYPENLVFSIAWQHSSDDLWDNLDEFKNDSRFKIIDINYNDSKGACWARNYLQKQYDGEDYTLQIDSHHRFIKGWDVECINMITQLQESGYEKPLLTSYVPSYDPTNDPTGRVKIPWKMNFDRFTPEGVVFFLPSSIENYNKLNEPIPSRFYSAHFCFTIGDFVLEVPHDPDYYFHGEEISISARAYTWGYDLFHPHKILLWHEYTRKGRTKHWDDDKNWVSKNVNSHLRNKKLFGIDKTMNDIDFGVYGFGNVRTLEDYERYSGISFKNRGVQKYTLENNPPPNPPIEEGDYENSFLKFFKYCINIYSNQVIETDYEFWVIAFEDKNGNTIYRKDVDKDELKIILSEKNSFYKVWRTFYYDEIPKKWVVWPYSTTKGWCKKIIGDL